MEPKVKSVIGQRKDPYIFVEVMTEIWANYQRYIFAHDFVMDKLRQTFLTFYKMGNAKDFACKGEIVAIPIIAVN